MNRLNQILREALDEVEIYNSWISSYYIIKSLENNIEKLCKEPAITYDITIDSLILLTIHLYGEIDKTRLFVTSFILYDHLSKVYKIQDPIFTIRWHKRHFIYSPRIDSHLAFLLKRGLVIEKGRYYYYLNPLGESEAINVYNLIKNRKSIEDIIYDVKKLKKIKDIKTYIRKYLIP
ncbi:MAG: hypothetical protein QW440_05620 [Saccharolobus sp.]